VTLTIEELLDRGVMLTEEQLDFFHHPENRQAVAVYGVPDPDRLYIAGPDWSRTIYQLAEDGEQADAEGYRACVLPLVIMGEDQQSLAQEYEENEGPLESNFPVVYGRMKSADWMWRFAGDESPMPVAVWDLWPISEAESEIWSGAAYRAYETSKIPLMHDLLDIYQGGEYYGPEHEDQQEELARLSNEAKKLLQAHPGVEPIEVPGMAALDERYKDTEKQMGDAAENWLRELEREILHPRTGDVDAQMPPIHLPQDQATIWSSLQALSWRNWVRLKKTDPVSDNDALYGGRFVSTNRRLCPWY
jgi:hypothetical protein